MLEVKRQSYHITNGRLILDWRYRIILITGVVQIDTLYTSNLGIDQEPCVVCNTKQCALNRQHFTTKQQPIKQQPINQIKTIKNNSFQHNLKIQVPIFFLLVRWHSKEHTQDDKLNWVYTVCGRGEMENCTRQSWKQQKQ